MPKAKTTVKRSPKESKVSAKAGKAAAKEVKETPKERLARLAEEKRAKARK
jgi:hypothetical protein